MEQHGGYVSTRESMKPTYCPAYHVHTTHTFRDTRGRSSQERLNRYYREQSRCVTGGGSRQSRGASSFTHLRIGRYPATFRERELQ